MNQVRAYHQTPTPVSRSQDHIRALLSKYGAVGVSFNEEWGKAERVSVRFLYKLSSATYTVRLHAVIEPQDAGTRRSQTSLQRLQDRLDAPPGGRSFGRSKAGWRAWLSGWRHSRRHFSRTSRFRGKA